MTVPPTQAPVWGEALDARLTSQCEQHIRALLSAQAIHEERFCCQTAADRPIGWTEGLAGMAVLTFEAGCTLQEPELLRRTERMLDAAFDGLTQTVAAPSRITHTVGVAAVAEYIACRAGVGDYSPNNAIDELLLAVLSEFADGLHFDLLRGLVGCGIYALLRYPRPAARCCLEAIVHQLAVRAIATESGGVTWLTQRSMMTPLERTIHSTPVANLGVAHGIPAIIAFLAQVTARGVALPTSRVLLGRALEWLVEQRLPRDAASVFPWTVPSPSYSVPRLGWCYGDSGIAAALGMASAALNDRVLQDLALSVGLHAAERSPASAHVDETCLCHGSAGIALAFKRLAEIAPESALERAALCWLTRTISQGSSNGEVRYLARDQVTGQWSDAPGLLTGSAGVGLVLLAALSGVPTEWDFLLLFSAVKETRL